MLAELRAWLRWAATRVAYVIRPYDMQADRRRWRWQRRALCAYQLGGSQLALGRLGGTIGSLDSTDPMAELHDAAAWIDRHRKTVLCPPDLVAAVRATIDRHSPVAGLYDVQPSALTDGHIYVIDHSALTWWSHG